RIVESADRKVGHLDVAQFQFIDFIKFRIDLPASANSMHDRSGDGLQADVIGQLFAEDDLGCTGIYCKFIWSFSVDSSLSKDQIEDLLKRYWCGAGRRC